VTVRISASLREHEELQKDRASRKIDALYTCSVNKVLYAFKLREVAQLIYNPDIRDYVHNNWRQDDLFAKSVIKSSIFVVSAP